jgi:hypothetical protein
LLSNHCFDKPVGFFHPATAITGLMAGASGNAGLSGKSDIERDG